MSIRIFVGNLGFTTTPEQLRSLFAESGEVVDVAIPTDRLDGRPRGFAFVEMASQEEGAAAIARLDGVELEGRNLRVNAAEDRSASPRPRGSGGGGGGYGASAPPPQRPRPKGSRRNVRARKRGF